MIDTTTTGLNEIFWLHNFIYFVGIIVLFISALAAIIYILSLNKKPSACPACKKTIDDNHFSKCEKFKTMLAVDECIKNAKKHNRYIKNPIGV